MSSSSMEWRHYMAEGGSFESLTAPGFPHKFPQQNQHQKSPGLEAPFGQTIPNFPQKNNSSQDSSPSSGFQSSQIFASPSGPPPGMKPHTLRLDTQLKGRNSRQTETRISGVPREKKLLGESQESGSPESQESGPHSKWTHSKGPSLESKSSPDSLIHTDHTGSDRSMEISLPYYNISNYSQSVNTFSMLARMESKSVSSQSNGSRPRARSDRSGSVQSVPRSFKRSSLNQVPPRFSQFILNQTTLPAPHSSIGQWDQEESSQNEPIGKSGDDPSKANLAKSKSSKSSKLYGPNIKAYSKTDSVRDISNSMDSQATIFSTKPEDFREAPSRWTGRSLRATSLRRRLTSKKKSSPAPACTVSDTASSLKRAKAIRYTGRTRQIRMYMRKLYYRLKKRFAQLFTFSASPKRATSTVKMKRQKNLVRKKRPDPKNPAVRRNLAISGPLENPTFTGAQKVDHLSDDLKRSAGADINAQVSDLTNERLGKYNHLSNYLDEQRELNIQQRDLGQIDEQKSDLKVPSLESNPVPDLQGQLPKVISSAILSESSSAPPPPPHGYKICQELHGYSKTFQETAEILVQDPKSEQSHDSEQSLLQSTWKSYLSNVVSQRIRLRQEIFLFQALLANEPVPDFFVRHSDDIVSDLLSRHSTLGNKPEEEKDFPETEFPETNIAKMEIAETDINMPRLPSAIIQKTDVDNSSVHTMDSGADALSTHSSETRSVTSRFEDDNVSEFQKVLNRRSMLGDMLNYDSDEFDTDDTSEITDTDTDLASHSVYSSNAASSNILLDRQCSVVERYGTVSRRLAMPKRRNTDKSSVYSSSIQGSSYLISRSPGVTNNLCGRTQS